MSIQIYVGISKKWPKTGVQVALCTLRCCRGHLPPIVRLGHYVALRKGILEQSLHRQSVPRQKNIVELFGKPPLKGPQCHFVQFLTVSLVKLVPQGKQVSQ